MHDEDDGDSPETELDDLRYRISQLEHLVVTKSLESTFNTSMPSTSIPTQESMLERVSNLETLLAASELENKQLREEIILLETAMKRQHVKNEERIKEKNKEILDVQCQADFCLKKSELNERKLKSMEMYINTLPSEEELESAHLKIKKLEGCVFEFETKVERLEARGKNLQTELFQKETQLQQLLLKLEELKPLEEAESNCLEDEKLERLNFSDEECVRKFIIVLKAKLIRSKSIIETYRAKVKQLNDAKSQYGAKIESLSLLLDESQEQYLNVVTQNEIMTDKNKAMKLQQKELSSKYEELQVRTVELLKSRGLRQDQYESIIRLVTEIDFCVTEMNSSILLGQRLLDGEDPDVDMLVGITDFDFEVDINISSDKATGDSDASDSKLPSYIHHNLNKVSTEGDVNIEWCLDKWASVRKSREELASLRTRLSDFYAKNFGEGDVHEGCTIQ